MSETMLSAGLHRWAAKRAVALADEFLRDHGDYQQPAEFLAEALKGEKLLAAMPATVHAAFMGRIIEAEADL